MTVNYDWAFARPIGKIYYDLTITGLSVAVALLIGTIELIGVLHDNLDVINPVTDWISSIDLNNFGFVIVGLFVVTLLIAILCWRLSGIEQRWPNAPAGDA